MLDLLQTSEAVSGHAIRVWTGVATDEGVGLIALVEVQDGRGVPLCRFEEFLGDDVRRTDLSWPRGRDEAAGALQRRALQRARDAILGESLKALHGHRYDVAIGTDAQV